MRYPVVIHKDRDSDMVTDHVTAGFAAKGDRTFVNGGPTVSVLAGDFGQILGAYRGSRHSGDGGGAWRAAYSYQSQAFGGHLSAQGNDRGYPCPTWEFPQVMDRNTYCILCMECVKSCPADNVAWNVRPWGADLLESTRPRRDEAYLAVIMLSMSAFHGLTMTPAWDRLVVSIQSLTSWGALAAFSVMAHSCQVNYQSRSEIRFSLCWCSLHKTSFRD